MSAHGSDNDDSGVAWDSPRDDDIVFEADSQTSADSDLEWDSPRQDDIVLGKFEDMIGWGDKRVHENLLNEAVRLYKSARRTLPKDGTHLEDKQLVNAKLSAIHFRCGNFESADLHMTKAGPVCTEDLRAKIANVKDHMIRAEKARKHSDWIAALIEVEAMIAAGVDSCQPIMTFRAEMLLRQDSLAQAEEAISRAIALESMPQTMTKFLNMPPERYFWAVNAQIELVLGRFDTAIAAAEKARGIDEVNEDISHMLTRTACDTGDKHYRSGDFLKAREDYKVGLAYATSDVSLLNNLAACHWQLQEWKICIDICDQVLLIQPEDDRALVLRASSFAKLEKWDESVKCYETAIKIYPGNAELTAGLQESQAALEKSQVTEPAETLL